MGYRIWENHALDFFFFEGIGSDFFYACPLIVGGIVTFSLHPAHPLLQYVIVPALKVKQLSGVTNWIKWILASDALDISLGSFRVYPTT